MATGFKIVQNNTAPTYTITCTRDGTPIDLTGSSVLLIIEAKGGSITNAGHQTCSLVTPASGIISYTALSTDFPSSGKYIGDIQVTYSGGGVEILYQQAKWTVRSKIT